MGCGQTPTSRRVAGKCLIFGGAGRDLVHARAVGGPGGSVGVPFGYRWGRLR